MNLEQELESDLLFIKKYIDNDLEPSSTTTTHKYESELPVDVKASMVNIKKSAILNSHLLNLSSKQNKITPVTEMNEVYCSKHRGIGSAAGSDAVFETRHIDGPFGLIPKMTLFRCIVTICNETETETIIKEHRYKMSKGEFVAIDYNRDLHFIKIKDDFKPPLDAKRYVLKLHYISHPSWCPSVFVNSFGFLNIYYNILARKAFLYTLNPTSFSEKSLNYVINTTTKLWSRFYQISA